MTLLDTLPVGIIRRQQSLAPAIDLLEAVLGRTSIGMKHVLGIASVQHITFAVEVLFLALLADTGLELGADLHILDYLRHPETIRQVAFIPCDEPYAARVAAAYTSFVDAVVAPRTGIFKPPSEEREDATAPSTAVGYGYVLAAAALMRMAITGEDAETLIERYRLADGT